MKNEINNKMTECKESIIVDNRLKKYVEAVVGIGVNIQPGQNLVITCDVDNANVARLAMEAAYRRGAADVMIRWTDDAINRIYYLMAPDERFGKVAEWECARMQYMVDNEYHTLSITADDPESLKGIDPERIEKDDKAYGLAFKPRSNQMMASEIQWVVASVPSVAWAKKVFPNAESDEIAVDLMWEAIFTACRIDEGSDPVANWEQHVKYLQAKAKLLNEYNFTKLHFANDAGTDLTVALPKNHIWLACGEKAKTGISFVANMPTEEVFTAPQKDGVDGIVYATKPLSYMGDVIDDFWLRFKDGKVIEYAAGKNENLLKQLVEFDEGASFLGEVALVPHSSPISQSGILWFNTLYDENASCHFALGEAYPTCVKGAADKAEAEQAAMGINHSLEHADFMIGSDDLDIIGTTQDGQAVQVFKQGEWAF